jgi:hypothetical protein
MVHKIPDLIKDNAMLTWDEPRPGINPDGREITVNIRLQMTARDDRLYPCIDAAVLQGDERSGNPGRFYLCQFCHYHAG